LFVFLHISGVPYDNNASERALRNSVIHRKVSGGFRSDAGAEAHAVVASVVDTVRKRGDDVFEALQGHVGFLTPVGE
jgi:transposase